MHRPPHSFLAYAFARAVFFNRQGDLRDRSSLRQGQERPEEFVKQAIAWIVLFMEVSKDLQTVAYGLFMISGVRFAVWLKRGTPLRSLQNWL
jgi:hypothetical protein